MLSSQQQKDRAIGAPASSWSLYLTPRGWNISIYCRDLNKRLVSALKVRYQVFWPITDVDHGKCEYESPFKIKTSNTSEMITSEGSRKDLSLRTRGSIMASQLSTLKSLGWYINFLSNDKITGPRRALLQIQNFTFWSIRDCGSRVRVTGLKSHVYWSTV